MRWAKLRPPLLFRCAAERLQRPAGVPGSIYTDDVRKRRSPETTARRALWIGGLLVVLAGLMGMHGLGDHGAAGMDSIPHSVVSEAGAGPAIGAVFSVVDHAVPHIRGVAPVMTTVSAFPGGGRMDMGMTEMCVAILVVALIVLLRSLRTSKTRSFLRLVARSARAHADTGRDPDPPSLIKLSIQRC